MRSDDARPWRGVGDQNRARGSAGDDDRLDDRLWQSAPDHDRTRRSAVDDPGRRAAQDDTEGRRPSEWTSPADPRWSTSSTQGTGSGSRPPHIAGFWIRLFGAFVDGLVLSVTTVVLAQIVGAGTSRALGNVLAAAYFTYFHSTSGRTVGNRAAGTQVVDIEGGGTLDAVRALLRWLVSILSGLVLFLGYLWMLFDRDRQTWHDKAARSNVVRLR